VPDELLALVFVAGAMLSLGSSWVLVTRLERVGARLGLSEALLGVLAALAADAPEITAAVTALVNDQARIGAGVVIGSNVFNLAALLGLGAVLAGGIALHRRVVVMEGVVAVWVAAVCLVVIVGLLSPAIGLLLALCVLVPYVVLLGVPRHRLRRIGLPSSWVSWLTQAIVEEELELEIAIHPRRGRARDAIVAVVAVLVVVGASLAMEQSASKLGARNGIPEIVVGALILAAVTSLPNAVAAVYLARRGRGAATLSTAMNSNALNVTAGLLLPATIVGLGAASGQGTLVAAWYLGLTGFALGCAYMAYGLRRTHGALIIGAYAAFVGMVLASAYSSPILMGGQRGSAGCGRARARGADRAQPHLARPRTIRGRSREGGAPRRARRGRREVIGGVSDRRAVDPRGVVFRSRDRFDCRGCGRDARAPRHPHLASHRGTVLRTAHRSLGTHRNRGRLGRRAWGPARPPGRDLGHLDARGVPRAGGDRHPREHRVRRSDREAARHGTAALTRAPEHGSRSGSVSSVGARPLRCPASPACSSAWPLRSLRAPRRG
jgi:cation:H+ antiporter